MELVNNHHSEEHGNRQAGMVLEQKVKILHKIHKQEAGSVGGGSGVGF